MSGYPSIRPNALSQADHVDALYMAFSSLYGICLKLDNDGGPLTTYVANCWTALINVIIEDTKGNRTGQGISESSTIVHTHIITPTGRDEAALMAAYFQFWNAFETLTEQLDADGLTFSNYEAKAFTAVCLHLFKNEKDNTVGNGTSFTFRPGGVAPQDKTVDNLYNMFNAIYVLCTDGTTQGLDGDATVNDTNYAALWYTANLLLQIENSVGSTIGVSR